jgi:chorismate synthase
VVAIGDAVSTGPAPRPDDLEAVDASEVRCFDPEASAAMVAAIDRAREERDTLGGVFEVLAFGVPPGIGSHVQYDRRLDAILAAAVISIPAIKGVEIGDGFAVAAVLGSEAHDEIVRSDSGIGRPTNRAGGIEGGMSNGEPLRVRGAMKPLSTLMKPLRTVDLVDGEEAQAFRERSDVCAVPAAAVVGEQMVAIALAGEFQRKFGGDTVDEFGGRVAEYRRAVARRLEP